MRTLAIVVVAAIAASFFPVQEQQKPTVQTVPPVVVKTIPKAGSVDVDPNLKEIRVTFSKNMRDRSWSWSTAWQDSNPEITGGPKYLEDNRTCVLEVKLQPGRAYGFWLNSERFGNFKDKDGRKAVPYLLVFETKPADK